MNNSVTEWTWAGPWWTILVAFAVVNVVLAVLFFSRSRRAGDDETGRYVKLMGLLGLIYVLVGAYRTVFVSSYLEQLAWFDTFLNSSLLIRFFAFFAEVSFAAIITLALRRTNREVPATSPSACGWFSS